MGANLSIYRWLFVFALLFAQTGGLVHGIAHTLSEQSQDQSLPHERLCDLCASYAQLGGALKSSPVTFVPVIQRYSPVAPLAAYTGYSVFAAFAARAPPRTA